jgi:uncharacterized protein YqeY
MSLKTRLDGDLKAAMKEKNAGRLTAIRLLRAAVQNKEIELGHALSDDEVIREIRTLVKQRGDSIAAFEKGGRLDLVESEREEKEILESYLPPPASDADIERVIQEVVDETGATGLKEMGVVMKAALARLGPAADGKRVSEAVRRILS